MSLPKTGSEVTHEWVEKVLVENNPSFQQAQILSLQQVEFTGGTLSCALRGCCRLKKTPDDESHVDICVFIKIMPEDEMFRTWANDSKMDVTEIETYRKILPELSSFEKARGVENGPRISPILYFGEYDLNDESRSWCLILEDLSDSHFMKNFDEGLTLDQLKCCLEKLGHFHALTHAYGKNSPEKLEEKYQFLSKIFKIFDSDPNFIEHFDSCLEKVLEDLRNDEALFYLLPSLKGLRSNVSNLVKTVLDGTNRKILIHGDLWANNFLFSRTQNECSIIDWQFTTLGNPLWDIGPVAFLSMDKEFTEQHLDEILQSYFNSLNLSCSNLGLEKDVHLWESYDSFKADALCSGLYITFVWSILSYPLNDMFTALRQRYLWVLKTSHKLHPELYKTSLNE